MYSNFCHAICTVKTGTFQLRGSGLKSVGEQSLPNTIEEEPHIRPIQFSCRLQIPISQSSRIQPTAEPQVSYLLSHKAPYVVHSKATHAESFQRLLHSPSSHSPANEAIFLDKHEIKTKGPFPERRIEASEWPRRVQSLEHCNEAFCDISKESNEEQLKIKTMGKHETTPVHDGDHIKGKKV
ncbi:unnamed protein product [Protopolystoma xenopodis]|uniref:Uncharacterized protein n=1 Tax=Protopolystoma xenopodis TaxID=117903 RepID=A0A448XLW9_9PLAT|nr:unnamed protein product [Protopolystoma xenopodis]